MVVVAVIAIIAGLTLPVVRGVLEKKAKKTVQAELKKLDAQIFAYHAKYNSYPLDNPTNTQVSPLFYELMGTTYDHTPVDPRYQMEDTEISESTVRTYFAQDGLRNVTQLADKNDPQAPKSERFIQSMKANDFRAVDNLPGVEIRLLRVPVKDEDAYMVTALDKSLFNAWHYRSTNPTNNHGKFDLWAEF
ncbi:MAG: hypothetical protein K0Q55_4054, partial [Verrucomicrobia bacterium]|nr:hypothetical protein [Verrucomicrobiota bacterium]